MARKNLNLGNLLVIAGMCGLGFSFWLPYGTADRVYRIERRAAENTRRFAEAALRRGEIDWQNTTVRAEIVAEVNEQGGSSDADSSRHLEAIETPAQLRGEAFFFAGKHYYYLIAHTPDAILGRDKKLVGPKEDDPDGGNPPPDAPPGELPVADKVVLPTEERTPFEAYAWPRNKDVSTRTVFFVPSDDEPAFTRNLGNRYFGLKDVRRIPLPGNGRFDIDTEKKENAYRGQDDERWIYGRRDTLTPK